MRILSVHSYEDDTSKTFSTSRLSYIELTMEWHVWFTMIPFKSLLYQGFHRYSFLYSWKLGAKKPREYCVHYILESSSTQSLAIQKSVSTLSLSGQRLWIGHGLFINGRSLEITLTGSLTMQQFSDRLKK